MNVKRFLCLMLTACLLSISMVFVAFAIEPGGNGVSFRSGWFVNDPGYQASAAYRTSVWYRNLSALSLTKNERNNVLRVAISQLGYHEGNSESAIDGADTTGTGNYVEYMRLVKNAENGSDWCACFVNWCLSQAGITHAGGEIGCQRWIEDTLKKQNQFTPSPYHGGTYTPQPADIIFFDWDENGAWADHVGFVLYADEATVYTIEGNTKAGNVGLRTYAKDSSFILGYGTPAYLEGDEATLDFSMSGAHSAGRYIVRTAQATLAALDGSTALVPLGETVTTDGGEVGTTTLTVIYDGVEGRMATADLLLLTPDTLPSGDIESSSDGGKETGTASDKTSDTEAASTPDDTEPAASTSESLADEPVDITSRPVDTATLSSVTYWRFAAEVTNINGMDCHFMGYRDPTDRSVRPSTINAADDGLTALTTIRLSGWALANAGQHSYVWSMDGTTWHAFEGGTLTRAAEEHQATAIACAALTNVNLRRGSFTDLTADLSAFAGGYISLYVGVIPVDEQTAVCHFLTLEQLWVGDKMPLPPETESESVSDAEPPSETESDSVTETESAATTESLTEAETTDALPAETDASTESGHGSDISNDVTSDIEATESEADQNGATSVEEGATGAEPVSPSSTVSPSGCYAAASMSLLPMTLCLTVVAAVAWRRKS